MPTPIRPHKVTGGGSKKQRYDPNNLPGDVGAQFAGINKLIGQIKPEADYDPANVDPFQQALRETQRERTGAASPQMQNYLQAGMPAQPQAEAGAQEPVSPGMASYLQAGLQQPEEAQGPGLLQRTKDYWVNKYNAIVHGEDRGGSHLHPTERAMEALGLIGDPLDFALGGFATALSGNPQGGILKWGLVKSGNALGAATGEFGRQALQSTMPGYQQNGPDFGAVYDKLVKGYNEQVNGANWITETLRGQPQLKDWIDNHHGAEWTKWLDFAANWYLGPKLARPLAPVFRFGGKAVRFGIDQTVAGLEKGVKATAERAPGFSRGLNSFINAPTVGLRELTNAGEDYRRVQEAVHREVQPVAAARQRLTRIFNTADNIIKKFQNDRTVTVYGDLLKSHPNPEIAARASNEGPLPIQVILHGAEAGSEGAFFNHKNEVLAIAADHNLPVEPLSRAIDEWKQLTDESGQQMVDTGLMDDKTFAANAGHWVRRIYRTNLKDQGARESLINEMVSNGIDNTRANNLVMALQAAGESGPVGVGVGLSTVGNKAKAFGRKLLTPEERIQFMPEYNDFGQAANAMIGQFKAAAMHRVFKTMAGDEALSAANKIKDYATGRQIDFSQTPRIKGMLQDVAEQIKAHQAKLTDRLEKTYNIRSKWVEEQDTAVRSVEKKYTKHVTSEPQKPAAPERPPALLSHNERVSDVLPIQGEGEAAVFKPKLSGVIENTKRQAAAAEYTKADALYVKKLADWQTKHQAWLKRKSELTQVLRDSNAELKRRQDYFGETEQQVGEWFDDAEKLQRRHDLLRGEPANDLHANDALAEAEKRLGFEITDPAKRQKWFDAWKNKWTSRGEDIFDVRNVEPPIAPKGVPEELLLKVDQNVFPAIALDEALSADGAAYSHDNHPVGWELWDGEGNRSYGAMEGRWAHGAIRRFIEDAIDPHRYERNVHPIFNMVKTLSNQFKALKLYYNPSTKYGIEIQSFWEAKATVNAAGVKFNPLAYAKYMREYKSWVDGKGPATPPVQAMLSGVREAGAGYMTAMSPEELPTLGKQSPLRRFAENNRQKFIEVQQFPKAGVAGLLIDAGFDPATAGQMAEQGFGARGGMGGIETHGVMQIAEGLNKYGVAIFTSYPLHSINRFLQLMATKPEVLMTYPILRQYLLQQVPGSQERDERGEVRGTMVPIPGIKNENGEPLWVDVANLIPHGGATSDLRVGGVLSPFFRAHEAGSALAKRGAAPDIAGDEQMRQGYFAAVPSIIGSGADALARSLSGQTKNPLATTPESPLGAAARLIGFPTQYAENATDRALHLEKEVKPSRVEFQQLYIERVTDGREKPEDYTSYTKAMDLKEAYAAQSSAQRYLANLLADNSIDDDRAKTMIRRQVDWVIAVNAAIQDQSNLYYAQQAQEGYDAEQADQYSGAGVGAGG
jgi:hypothetical protein